ncbi:MAG: hypothetical protein HY034_05945 [Nitrospirae bacterium]|nr:hypothetical protein [Nitrospirota bacterium]
MLYVFFNIITIYWAFPVDYMWITCAEDLTPSYILQVFFAGTFIGLTSLFIYNIVIVIIPDKSSIKLKLMARCTTFFLDKRGIKILFIYV